MNRAFLIIEQWMNVNKLKMNVEKTKYMIVRGIRKEQRGKLYRNARMKHKLKEWK